MSSNTIPSLLIPGGAAAEAVRSIDDWTSVMDDAAGHGVVPLLHNTLASLDIPTEVSERIRDVYIHSILRAKSIQDDAAIIGGALRDVGVQALALKGLHVAFGLYDEPALRPMNDIDLLVRDPELETATEAMRAIGYKVIKNDDEGRHNRPMFKSGSMLVELHHALEPRHAPFSTDMEGVWKRASTMSFHGVDILAMALDDLLLHVCTHAAYNHCFEVRLRSLVDIAVVVRRPDLDWDRLVETANQDGRSRYVYTALHVSAQLWPDLVPFDRVEDLDHGPNDAVIAAIAVDQIANPPVDVPIGLRAVRTSGGVWSAILSVLSTLFLPPHRMREFYGLESGSRLPLLRKYLVRPFDLVFRRGRDLAAIVLRTERGRSVLAQEERERRISAWAEQPAVDP